jgi:hypothetical protein
MHQLLGGRTIMADEKPENIDDQWAFWLRKSMFILYYLPYQISSYIWWIPALDSCPITALSHRNAYFRPGNWQK